jgi:copper(I)-binding protein
MPTPTTASATPTMGHGMSGHGMGSATPTVGNEFQAGMLVIRNVWARPATKADGLSAVYMVIENTGDQPDRLLHAHCDVAGTVELHETKMEGGVMKMQPVDGIDIPAKGTVELKPGGLHIMLIGLTRDLNPGDEIGLELHFDKAGHVPVKAIVQKP